MIGGSAVGMEIDVDRNDAQGIADEEGDGQECDADGYLILTCGASVAGWTRSSSSCKCTDLMNHAGCCEKTW